VTSENNTDEIICPSCVTANPLSASFCDSCGAPVGTATLDPIQSISAQGFLFRKALEGRPKPIVVAGIWLMFFPLLLGSIFAAARFIVNRTGLADFVFFWVFVGFGYVAFVILYRVTRNYLKGITRKELLEGLQGN
jgi:hypothetical protein